MVGTTRGSHTLKWVGFSVSNTLTRTLVHFFPASGNVTAPYPTVVKLSVFGNGLPVQRVMLEGARLNHPDGVRLEQAFPVLEEHDSGIYGLACELSASEPRVDLQSSACVVELSSRGRSTRYWAKDMRPSSILASSISETEEEDSTRTFPVILDNLTFSSLLMINSGEETCKIDITLSSGEDHDDPADKPVQEELPPHSLAEVTFKDELVHGLPSSDFSWGSMRAGMGRVHSDGAQCFLVHRDHKTRRPVSVCAL